MVDIIILGIILFSLLVSLWRGFVREVLSLAGWVIAFFIASKFYLPVSQLLLQIDWYRLQRVFEVEYFRYGIAAAILFITVIIISGILNVLIAKLVDKTGLSGTDRVLGAGFGLLRGIFIVAAILFFLETFTHFNQSPLWKDSQLIPHFDFIVKWFFEQLQANSTFLNQTN